MKVRLWLTYFQLNAMAPQRIPWDIGADLPADEIEHVVPSIQEFQLGECSGGDRLRGAAAAWAERHGDADFPQVVDLFIAEEQRHAAELARYLALNGQGLRPRTAADSAFRFLRHLTGRLEVSMSVLMTAEIIGFVYYGALREATRSSLLRSICDTFLLDEAVHLLFHMDQLSRLSQAPIRPVARLAGGLSWLLMAAACGIVWTGHRSVLKRGGLTLPAFFVRCFERRAFVAGSSRRRPASDLRHPRPAGSAG